MTVLAALLLLLVQQLGAAIDRDPNTWYARLLKEQAGWMALPPVALAAAYVFLFFGFLSRRCERQADIFGCRAVSCANPNCGGHDETTDFPPRGAALCPTGIRTFTRALERVGLLNGFGGPEEDHHPRTLRGFIASTLGWLRAWQHSTMPRRVAFLLSLIDDPARERRFQRRVFLLRWGMMLGLGVLLAVLGEVVGWRELLKTL
jgi:STE24 endopeptidase